MFKYLFFTLLIGIVVPLSAQKYKVIHVNGQIQKVSNKKLIDRGASLEQKEKLNYLTQGARAVVVDTEAGKRVILQNAGTGESTLQASITPSMGNMSSRGGALLNRLDVKNYFNGKFAILETLKVPVNPQVYPQSDTQFFFIRMVYKGEPINKKLYFKGDTLLIQKDSLLQVDHKPIKNEDITDMELMYYSNVNGKIITSSLSNTFYPVFPDTKLLKEEVDLLLSILPKDYKKSKLDFVQGYINDAYGKTSTDNVKTWYEKNIKVKK